MAKRKGKWQAKIFLDSAETNSDGTPIFFPISCPDICMYIEYTVYHNLYSHTNVYWCMYKSSAFQNYLFSAGASRSHFRSFRDIRDAEIDRFVVETNKILIRLEKVHSQLIHIHVEVCKTVT